MEALWVLGRYALLGLLADLKILTKRCLSNAVVFKPVGGVSYYLISRDTLTGMNGKRGHDLLTRGFRQDIKARLASL